MIFKNFKKPMGEFVLFIYERAHNAAMSESLKCYTSPDAKNKIHYEWRHILRATKIPETICKR